MLIQTLAKIARPLSGKTTLRSSRLAGWLVRLADFPVKAYLAGIGFGVYVSMSKNSRMLIRDDFEGDERRRFAALIRKLQPKIFFDIGANFGLYSWIVKSVCPDCVVVCLEPDASNIRLMRKTIEENAIDKIFVVQKAVAGSEGRMAFFSDELTGGTGSLESPEARESFVQRQFGRMPKAVEVETTTVDSLVSRFGEPDLMKIDVEGAELSVLQGAAGLFERRAPIVFLETAQDNKPVVGERLQSFYRFFKMSDWRETEGPSFNSLLLPRRLEPDYLADIEA
ncbi:MAG: FkbM family methyltransferase [Bacteroidetes bacterium]|nr:FkbM family methyltransferase [Bacteroidota bacterium]